MLTGHFPKKAAIDYTEISSHGFLEYLGTSRSHYSSFHFCLLIQMPYRGNEEGY